ncbi:MAG: FAD-linked oxidase C-terminal domain-containing protein [Halobacteria archaeon]|nr:FAD-linked oxidase C-terminal domain-containing protein [Halobacteria archaeon]
MSEIPSDPRADYTYTSNSASDIPSSVESMKDEFDCEVRLDDFSRSLYATDASIYEETPIAVTFPESTEDVSDILDYCSRNSIPVLPRGGGTSLAGQAVNEAVVLDFTRRMDSVVDVDTESRTATVEAGAVVEELNTRLEDHGLKFAPDPAWRDKSTVGGAIGNNSTGSHSLKYGKTGAYIERSEVVLADGTVTTFGEIRLEELREKADPDGDLEERIYEEVLRTIDEESETVEETYPDLKRNVSGYSLDRLVEEAKHGKVNLARLLAGSEGTLGVVTRATLSLEEIPAEKSAVLLSYSDLSDALKDVSDVLDHDPAAVEVLDDVLIDLARDTDEFSGVVEMLPDGTSSVLLTEFYAEDDSEARRKVESLVDDRLGNRAFDHLEAYDDDRRERFWKLRKSGLPILLSRTTDEKHISFIEDTAVRPEDLPEYVSEFEEILEDHGTFASFYAHAGPGCLHIRPLVNTKTNDGVEKMESIADEVTDLVVEYGGSVSGEHGDGRARTQWNSKLYGDEVWEIFRDLKSAFDPDWILNPGQVCGDVSMTDSLRHGSDYSLDAGSESDSDTDFETSLNWDNENGFEGMVELCHGCGGCRGKQETTGGVMCPTYRASEEEITSTRGRANLLRRAMSGDLDADAFDTEFMAEVMDLCIGCKGCATDCPSGVDMAKMKAEIENEYHDRHGASLRERIFANPDKFLSLGSTFAPVSNLVTQIPGARYLLEKTVGIARERPLPEFERETFEDRFPSSRVSKSEAEAKAVLVVDPQTNYTKPEVGIAAVDVLESLGVHVDIRTDPTGRAAYSQGFVDGTRATAEDNVSDLGTRVSEGWDVVALEPSDAVMLQSDYLDLIARDEAEVRAEVERVASNTYGFFEYVDTVLKTLPDSEDSASQKLVYHGHCHQKAAKKDHHALNVLDEVGYEVEDLDSGCCGMAGSFGYESEHYSMSAAIGEILLDQIETSDGDVVVAPGASCRTQLEEYDGEVVHPVFKLSEALLN